MSRRDEDFLEDELREAGSSNQRQTLVRLARLLLKRRKTLWIGSLLLLTVTGLGLLEPWLFARAVDHGLVARDIRLVRELAGLILLSTLLRVSFTYLQAQLFERAAQSISLELRTQVFARLQRLPISHYDRMPVGKLVTRVTNDVTSMSEMFTAGMVLITLNVLTIVGMLGWILYLDFRLGLIVVGILPVLAAVTSRSSGKLRNAYRQSRARLSALNASLAENILGMRVIQLFQRQQKRFDRWKQLNESYSDAQMGTVRVFAVLQPAITLAQGLGMALLIAFGTQRVANGGLPLVTLVAFFSYMITIFNPMRELADRWNVLLSGLSSAERLFATLDWAEEEGLAADPHLDPARGASPFQGRIEFQNVWFSYGRRSGGEEGAEAERWILRDFSCVIEAGQKVGIVGHTGAGKSTLISLLLRFHQPNRGRILLDGVDLQDFGKRELRRRIGLVQQDVFLFSGSLIDNVTMWSQDSDSQRRARNLLVQVGGEAFAAEALLERELEERGGNLSMGQRQVLAFARAAVRDPGLWILDEATANIDVETETRVNQALQESARGKTCLVVAHRLATVRDADQILVLQKGRLIERGTHEELVQTGGLYARLYRYQNALAQDEADGASSPLTDGDPARA